MKREGENLGLPTSASKRSKRNPLSGIQKILPSRPTIRLKKSQVQAAADKASQQTQGQGHPAGNKADPRGDQENMHPNSQIPLPPQKRTVFSNPFTKKRQSVPPDATRPSCRARGAQAGNENKKPPAQTKGEFY